MPVNSAAWARAGRRGFVLVWARRSVSVEAAAAPGGRAQTVLPVAKRPGAEQQPAGMAALFEEGARADPWAGAQRALALP